MSKDCSRQCESSFCSVPPLLRYGKYCGLLYSGCPRERPCDALDACCMKHDQCVQEKKTDVLRVLLMGRNLLAFCFWFRTLLEFIVAVFTAGAAWFLVSGVAVCVGNFYL